MGNRYHKHYTREEARALCRRCGLAQKNRPASQGLEKQEERLAALMEPGRDLGGENVNAWVRTMAELRQVFMNFTNAKFRSKILSADCSTSRPSSAARSLSLLGTGRRRRRVLARPRHRLHRREPL